MPYDTPSLNTIGVAAGVLLGIDGKQAWDDDMQTKHDGAAQLQAEW